jgi:hypothetical protein
MFSLENHFNKKEYYNLDYYTKQTYIEYIKELSKLCRGREWDGYFPEYLISRIALEVKLDHWHRDKKLVLEARDCFIIGLDPEFISYF